MGNVCQHERNTTNRGQGKCWKMTAIGSPSDPALLKEQPRDIPPVGPKEVIVKVAAAALNPIDYKLCEGKIAVIAVPPFTCGFDFAGVVEQAGAQSGFEVGAEVFGDVPNLKESSPLGGSLSTYILAPSHLLALKPPSLTPQEACSMPLVGMTVLDCLAKAAASNGARVLIIGASGGVGTMAVQIAKAKGLHVIGVCSGRNSAMVTELGANEVIDYTQEDWSVKLQSNKVEVVFDFAPSGASSVESWQKSNLVLLNGGRFITISGDDPNGEITIGKAVGGMAWSTVQNTFGTYKYHLVLKSSDAKKLEELSALVAEGKLKPVIEEVYEWKDVHQAFAKLMSGRASGKVVVTAPTGNNSVANSET